MTHDPRHPEGGDITEPVEVQRYGPPPARQPRHEDWQAAPAWSSRPEPAPQPVERQRRAGMVPVIAIAVVAGIVSGGLSAVAVSNLIDDPVTSGGQVASETPDADQVSEVRIEESNAVITATTKVAPAVVTITTATGGLIPGAGTGSGVIYDADGWILTNRHVAGDAASMVVTLADSRTFDATLVGVDTLTDLAIVKIDGTDLPTAPIGSSGALEIGQLAIAIGNPLGDFADTVTTGVVSGLGRSIVAGDGQTQDDLRHLIQTDAAINPGNSGGPLVNSLGQVIGINTAVSSNAQGIGFAIPIDFAKPVMALALAGEPIVRPYVGVFYTMITPQLAIDEDLPVEEGALIDEGPGGVAVIPGTPADAAGLESGDIITEVGGRPVVEGRDIVVLLLPFRPGDTVPLTVLRGGEELEIEVTLGELPDNP
jgi:S1-C subfamily serine protease